MCKYKANLLYCTAQTGNYIQPNWAELVPWFQWELDSTRGSLGIEGWGGWAIQDGSSLRMFQINQILEGPYCTDAALFFINPMFGQHT